MTDDPESDRRHRFSEGQGFDDDYREFTLDPETVEDPSLVDPVDSHVLTDLLDERNVRSEDVDAESLLDVGLSYVRINRFEEATETLERAARYAGDDETGVAQEAWVNKGVAHAELEEYDEAIGAYREALRLDDDSEHAASAQTNLAYALWESGRTEEALHHAERAVELDPRFPQAWYNRGFFLAERGLLEDAVDAFDNALRLGMRNPDVHDEKARALEELGRDEEAERAAERAEELREEAERRLVEDQ
jgi:tetratricopeptide (TPR) repeat protein